MDVLVYHVGTDRPMYVACGMLHRKKGLESFDFVE